MYNRKSVQCQIATNVCDCILPTVEISMKEIFNSGICYVHVEYRFRLNSCDELFILSVQFYAKRNTRRTLIRCNEIASLLICQKKLECNVICGRVREYYLYSSSLSLLDNIFCVIECILVRSFFASPFFLR